MAIPLERHYIKVQNKSLPATTFRARQLFKNHLVGASAYKTLKLHNLLSTTDVAC